MEITNEEQHQVAKARLQEVVEEIGEYSSNQGLWKEKFELFNAIESYHNPILHKLRIDQVFEVSINENNEAVFMEMCDECFGSALTKAELLQLIGELRGIADQMTD